MRILEAGYEVSSLEELEACRGKCYVQLTLSLGCLYEFRDINVANRGIKFDVYSIAFWPTPVSLIVDARNDGNAHPMFAREISTIQREKRLAKEENAQRASKRFKE